MIEVKFEENNNIRTEPLYQWDSNQLLHIVDGKFGSVAPRVHFANKKSNEATVVQSNLQDDGSIIASIPNTLLKEKYDIIAYIYTNSGITSKTITTITIPIIQRLKPSEYIDYTDEDILEIEKIELEAKAIIDGLTASEYNPSETYNRPNIVYYQNSSYMCLYHNVTGVLPTDTTKWTKIANGFGIANISVNQDGNLVFTSTNGDNFVVEIATDEVEYIDEHDIPCFALTKNDVTNIKRPIELYQHNVYIDLYKTEELLAGGQCWDNIELYITGFDNFRASWDIDLLKDYWSKNKVNNIIPAIGVEALSHGDRVHPPLGIGFKDSKIAIYYSDTDIYSYYEAFNTSDIREMVDNVVKLI